MLDLLIQNATLVTPAATLRADLAIDAGKIVDIAPTLHSPARQTIHAQNLHLFPGVIDSHVHFNDAGSTTSADRADWEGIPTGSAALAAGGGTAFFDMPLNSIPPTLDAPSFAAKLARAHAASHTDFAFWGGLTPANLDHMEALADCGVIGFKAFMCNTGVPEFLRADDDTLFRGMQIAAKLNLPVALHAEDEPLVSRLTAQARAAGKTTIRDYLNSRPIEAEVLAIRKAIAMAVDTGCSLHIVHVTSAEALAEVRGASVLTGSSPLITAETCPHYLLLTDADVESLGSAAKCSPPIRSELNCQKLLKQLLAGNIHTVGSDHSPAPASLKTSADFFSIWGGISSIQLTLRVLLTLDVPLLLIAQLLAQHPASRFRLPNKGSIKIGNDADFTLIDLHSSHTLTRDELLDRHKLSPYLGRPLRGKILRTLLGGQTIFLDGKITAPPSGQLLRPVR